jgi:pectate lyase
MKLYYAGPGNFRLSSYHFLSPFIKSWSLPTCLVLSVLLSACGGDNDNRDSICGSQSLTGRFIDSPVEGVRYNSYDIRVADAGACHFGTTNSNGEFFYEPGHHVLFRFCRACPAIASFPAQAIVTPADIVDAASSIDEKGRTFRNLLRFIQTLDVDGDPNNGIRLATIPTAVYYEAYPLGGTIMDIDVFDVDESEFEKDDAILTIIGRVTNTSNLVDANIAEEHFDRVIAGLPDYEDPRLSW